MTKWSVTTTTKAMQAPISVRRRRKRQYPCWTRHRREHLHTPTVATTGGVESAARSDKRGRLEEGPESQTAGTSPNKKKAKRSSADKKAEREAHDREDALAHSRAQGDLGPGKCTRYGDKCICPEAPRRTCKWCGIDWHHICANNYDDSDVTCPCQKE